MFPRWVSLVLLSTKVAIAAPMPALENRLAVADGLYKARAEAVNAQRALDMYRELYAQHPDRNTAWRLSMACYFVGLRQTTDHEEKAKIFDEGRKAGFFGAKSDDTCAECHFWGAINLALYGDTIGALRMLFALGEVKEHLRRSIELQPSYASGGAYRLLGLIDQKLPGILGGDNDRAREFFAKAIAVAPDEPLNYLFMAKLSRDEFHDREAFHRFVNLGLGVAQPSSERLESIESLAELRKLADENIAQAR